MTYAVLLALALLETPAIVAERPGAPVAAPVATRQTFDIEAATRAYLDRIPAEKQALSNAYAAGNYWLQLWGFLWGSGVALLLLATGLSARMRDRAIRLGRVRAGAIALYWAQYLVAATVLSFPLSLYQEYFRERQYGHLTQSFGGWAGDQGKSFLVSLVLLNVLLIPLYAVLRRAPRTWWLWGALVTVTFLAFVMVIFPVYLAPVFNAYKPVEDPQIRDRVLRLARMNGLRAEVVWEMDSSRQGPGINANVSGFLGTERITLNDNLIKRCTPETVEAVMGHEIGHYVLHHNYIGVAFMGSLILLGFAWIRWSFERARLRWGGRWGVTGIDDPAGLPLLVLLAMTYFFVLTPVSNTFIRTIEGEADVFGLNTARQPDGMAAGAVMLGEFRKLEPGPLEEFVFFNHPSGRTRIRTAMRWKAENLPAIRPEAAAPAPAPAQ